MLFEKIYYISPIFIQNFLITLYGKKLIKIRYDKHYNHYLKLYLEKKQISLKDEQDHQFSELKKFLQFAKKNSPHYRNVLSDIDLDKFNSINDLSKLPALEKETLRKNIHTFYTVNEKDAIKSFTGGTTGTSLEVYFTKNDFQKRMAYLDAFKYKSGIRDLHTKRKATFSGRSFATGVFQKNKKIFWRTNKAYNQRLYSTFDMQNENLHYYVINLDKYSPQIINGFVSSIYQIAKYILEKNINISYKPEAIFTTSENLLPFHREAIEKAFHCKIYNQYASAEGAPFITECVKGKLHYNLDTGVIEVMEDGEILITSFTTHGTPLIRYKIGDRITLPKEHSISAQVCACGSYHPIVSSIDGRSVDYLFSPEKGKVSLSHLADVIKGIPNSIKEVQFHQNQINLIEIYVSVDENQYSDKDKQKIIGSMKYRFGNKMNFKIHHVDDISRTRGGKFPLIKNNLTDF